MTHNTDQENNFNYNLSSLERVTSMNKGKSLKIFFVLVIVFLIFSQLVINFRQNFSVTTYPVSSYSLNSAKEIIWEISPESNDDWDTAENEKRYFLSEQLIESWALISPKYLANFWTDEWNTLIKKNFDLYQGWNFDINVSKDSSDSEEKLSSLMNLITKKEQIYWDLLKTTYLSDSPDRIDNTLDQYVTTLPILTWEWNALAWENCLNKNWDKRTISLSGICARKWYYLALRTFINETLDKGIAFPIKIGNDEFQLKKFTKDGLITKWYESLFDFLKKNKILNVVVMENSKKSVYDLKDWLKHIALFDTVYQGVFDNEKWDNYATLTLNSISTNFSDYLPTIVRSKPSTQNEEKKDDKPKQDDKQKQEENKQTQTQNQTDKKQWEKKSELEMTDEWIINIIWTENEKNNLNYKIVKHIIEQLWNPTYNYFNDILSWQSASISYNTANKEWCVLRLWDSWKIIYPTWQCISIKEIVGINDQITTWWWTWVQKVLNKVWETADSLLTDERIQSDIKWVNFSVPLFWILGVNKDWVWFWVKWIEQINWVNTLVIKQYKFNYAWPTADTSWEKAKLFMKWWSLIVQIIYFFFYFSMYFVFLWALSLIITTILSYKVDSKEWN